MFSVHNTFSYFMNMDSMKNRDIWKKFVYYVLLFLSAGTYAEKVLIMSCFSCQLGHMRKSSYYVPYKCHNRTFVASSRPYVPLDFYRRTFYYLLSICPIQISQQDILGAFSSIYPICLTQRDLPFFFICPILFFWQTFCIEEL